MKSCESFPVFFGVLLVSLGTIVGSAIIRGWVLAKLWAWFVVPIFALPPLHVATALGLSTLVACFMPVPDKKEEKGLAVAIGGAFAVPLFRLLFGWIVHLCL